MFVFFILFTATLDQTVLNEMRRCTMVFYSKEIGSKIRQHHTLHIHFIQLCLEINQSLYSSRRLHVLLVSCMDIQSHRPAKFPNPNYQIPPGQKLTLGNYLQCNRRTKPDRKPKPIPAQGNYPQGYLGQKASVTAAIVWPKCATRGNTRLCRSGTHSRAQDPSQSWYRESCLFRACVCRYAHYSQCSLLTSQ